MTEPLPEGFPTAEEIVAQYIKLRNIVETRKKEFEKIGASEADQELIARARIAGERAQTSLQIGDFLTIADCIDIANRLEALLTPLCQYTEAMTALEGAANMLMTATGQKALSTTAGTAFYKSVMSVKNEDPEAFLAFVREHQAWGALTAHVRKEFVEEWMDSHEGHPPPAISVERFRRVEFRKA
jgi:hypothetical protein